MQVIIIGGNPAGLSAASAIRKVHEDWTIDVYEKSQYISYGSCGIPYFVADEVKRVDALITLTQETLEKKRKIPVHLHHEVVVVDFKQKMVKIRDLKAETEFEKKYDYLVIAVGGESKNMPVESQDGRSDHPRLFKVHTLDHATVLKEFLETVKPTKIAVIGSGYIGLEMLEAYEAQGVKDITVIGPRLSFRSQSQEFIQKELEKHNIKIVLQKRVSKVVALSNAQLKVVLDDGEEISADAVQLSTGVVPSTQMFAETGLHMLANGAIVVDGFGRTNIEGVYAAGDCVTSYHNLLKKNVYVPLAPAANKQGRIVGSHIAGEETDPFPGIVGTAIFKVFDLYCSKTGITKAEARDLGYDAEETLITNNEIAHYYPNAKKMSLLVVFDKKTHLFLGAEITAPSPMGGKKIDVLATCLAAGMKIDDLQKLDLAYAPPFAPVWDPILIAANVSIKKCDPPA